MRPLLAILVTLLFIGFLPAHAQSGTSNALIAQIDATLSGTSPISGTGRWYYPGEVMPLYLRVSRCDQCEHTEHAHAIVQLPPGVSFVGFTGYNYLQGTCTAAAADAAGQRVTCTGTRGLGGGLTQHGAWKLDVRADAMLPSPTPLRFVLSHDDYPTPQHSRLDACIANTTPSYCDELNAIARNPPEWDLHIDSVEAQPAGYFHPGVTGKRAIARISSRGEIGTRFFLDVRLPPGYQHNASNSGGNPIGASCNVIGGNIGSGTIVRCIGATWLNPPNQTWVSIGVDVHPLHISAPEETIVFATGSSEPAPDSDRLIQCAANPNLTYCAWLQVSASACPEHPGLSQPIWCNGFEAGALRGEGD